MFQRPTMRNHGVARDTDALRGRKALGLHRNLLVCTMLTANRLATITAVVPMLKHAKTCPTD